MNASSVEMACQQVATSAVPFDVCIVMRTTMFQIATFSKQWSGCQHGAHLKEDTSNAPHVHLVGVVTIGEQALWRSVPAGGDVFGVWLLRIDASTAAKVCQLQALINDQDVFWLDIPVSRHCLAACNEGTDAQALVNVWQCYVLR